MNCCIASGTKGLLLVLFALATVAHAFRDEPTAPATATQAVYPDMPAGAPPALVVENASATDAGSMKAYREVIPGADIGFDLLPIPGGSFTMGSPESEDDRKDDEGPQHAVAIEPFWMGRCEVTWDEFRLFQYKLDQQRRVQDGSAPAPQDAWADAVSRPTPPYVPMDFGMGVEGFPAVCMTQFAARHYTKWLSMKTGRIYRLPTEAEWEYACRAGTTTAYSFGDDADALDEYGWFFDNADDKYHEVGRKKPNPWGLFDMHGNVAEWVLDAHDKNFYATTLEAAGDGPAVFPVSWPTDAYPHVVRGGSYDDDADRLRSAARRASTKAWKVQDPQQPKSIWYLTDAPFVGFRVVRPLRDPAPEELAKFWDADVAEIEQILAKQRKGGR
jgi:formylglycine-generating enzyme required for sulfatase activity